jgi:serine/threonine protein kinase
MSVEPSEAMSELWTRWQGYAINGVFPLGRYLGCSDHSGVFLTKSAARGPAEVAIKLVPTNRALAESQLPRWKRAGSLAHPHLLRLFEWGGCQLDGLPYLYTVMEYADQTLAQLLQHRVLTEDETREMLPQILDALAFLHSRSLVQGQLKPANILVVGDQLKLASDTIRRVNEGTINAPTRYDPPEGRQGSGFVAADIWALGISLFEALTRRAPSGWGEPREAVMLPADFSPAFCDVTARCLSPRQQDRPTVAELADWVRGRPLGSAPVATPHAAVLVPPEPGTPEPAPQPAPQQAASPPLASDAARHAPSVQEPQMPPAVLAVIVGIFAILALGWGVVHMLKTHRTPAPPPVEVPDGSLSQTPGAALPTPAAAPAPVAAPSPAKPGQSDMNVSPAALQQVIPEVPLSARRTIRGHIRVWVRVIVREDGSVFAAVADRTGPSSYFQRLAIESAKKWTFPPVDTPPRRLMQVRFDFGREGTTGRAVTLH